MTRPIDTQLSRCSYCQLKAIESFANTRGEVVTVEHGQFGVAVHTHREGVVPTGNNWTAWFLELSEQCSCDDAEDQK